MMGYLDVINRVSEELDLPKDLVDKTYKAYWSFIKESIQKLPLKEELSDKEFSELHTSFNIPSLGKLSCTYDRYLGVKKRFKYINCLREKNDKAKED